MMAQRGGAFRDSTHQAAKSWQGDEIDHFEGLEMWIGGLARGYITDSFIQTRQSKCLCRQEFRSNLQESNGNVTLHSCGQIDFDFKIELDVDPQTALLLLLWSDLKT